MKFKKFSDKQMQVLKWWNKNGSRFDGIICDGAVRSGKTLCMSVSFASWAMLTFNGGNFAICGKTIRSVKRNVVTPLMSILRDLGFEIIDRLSSNQLDVSSGRVCNTFYIFPLF